jgi:hypothetical protein
MTVNNKWDCMLKEAATSALSILLQVHFSGFAMVNSKTSRTADHSSGIQNGNYEVRIRK